MASSALVGTPVASFKAGAARTARLQRASRATCRPVFAVARPQVNAKATTAQERELQAGLVTAAFTLLASHPALAQELINDAAAPSLSLSSPNPAVVDQAVSSLIDIVKAAGELAKRGVDAGAVGLDYVKDAYGRAYPVVKSAADTAAPYVDRAVKTATSVAEPALKAVEPTMKAGAGKVEEFLAAQGLNPGVVVDAGKTAVGTAGEAVEKSQPTINKVIGFLASKDPTTLGQYALAAVATYYLAPPVLRGFFGLFRGFAGEVTAAAALDQVVNSGNTYIVDIRTAREKESGGIPNVPANNKVLELEYAALEDRKLRNQLRNPSAIEVEVTAMQVASAKKIGKGSTLFLLDKNGGAAKAVAKELSRKGFKKAYVIQGGFEGRNGWTASKLQTKLSNSVSGVEILPPLLGTIRTTAQRAGGSVRKALPSGR